jgi:hypothetical protein
MRPAASAPPCLRSCASTLPPAAVTDVAENHRRAALVLPAGHPPEVELAPGLGWLAESEGRSGRSGGRCDVAGGDMPASGAGGDKPNLVRLGFLVGGTD